jgi:hypothetical protein
MIHDSAYVEHALVAYLAADPILATLLPDGIYLDRADVVPDAAAFAVVMLVHESDVLTFEGRVGEVYVFLVLATARDTIVTAAAARIDALLEDAIFPIPGGFTLQAIVRSDRIAHDEPDPVDPDVTWTWHGGEYGLLVALDAATTDTNHNGVSKGVRQ